MVYDVMVLDALFFVKINRLALCVHIYSHAN